MHARVSLLALLLLGTTLAGCLSNPPTPNLTPPQDLEKTAQWVLDAAGNLVDASLFPGEIPSFDIVKISDRISGEPTIGITRTGAVFYPAIDFDVYVPSQGNLPSTRFIRSTDGGETWTDKSPQVAGVRTHPTSFDPFLYVDPTTGRVWAAMVDVCTGECDAAGADSDTQQVTHGAVGKQVAGTLLRETPLPAR